MTNNEFALAMQFKDDDASVGLAIAYGLVCDDGSQVFTKLDGEDAKEFGCRVLAEADLPGDTQTELLQAILKLSRGITPKQADKLEKN